jgi:hypothetical protein
MAFFRISTRQSDTDPWEPRYLVTVGIAGTVADTKPSTFGFATNICLAGDRQVQVVDDIGNLVYRIETLRPPT